MSGFRTAALIVALLALMVAPTGVAGSGGIGPSGSGGATGEPGGAGGEGEKSHLRQVRRHWDRASSSDRRWAHNTSECESGEDPNAIALGGQYRGAFMFTLDAWRIPKQSPGGDPIDYSWKTQAVVALALRKQLGDSPWPACG